MLLEYAMKNGAFRLKNSIWPTTNALKKCFQGQIQDHYLLPPSKLYNFLLLCFLGRKCFLFELSAWKD